MKEVDARPSLKTLLLMMLAIVLYGTCLAVASSADALFPSMEVDGLKSIATGLVGGAGFWAISTAIRRGEEIRRLRSATHRMNREIRSGE